MTEPRKRAPRKHTAKPTTAKDLVRPTTDEDMTGIRPLANGFVVRLPSGKDQWAPTRKRAVEIARSLVQPVNFAPKWMRGDDPDDKPEEQES